MLQLQPLTSALLVFCSVVDLGIEAPSVSTVILKSPWNEERLMKLAKCNGLEVY